MTAPSLEVPVAPPACATWPSLRFKEWPDTDRRDWRANTAPSHPFDDPTPGGHYAERSLHKFEQGYARWLGFLVHRGWLNTEQPLEDRVTPERLNAYFIAMRAVGNRDTTVVGRFIELSRALAILRPGRDWRWVKGPGGRPVIPRRLWTRRTLVVPHPRVVYRFGHMLMNTAPDAGRCIHHAVRFRDGLIVALEGARGRRLRSIAGLRVGTELLRQADGRWRIDLPGNRVKTGKADSFVLPADLPLYIDRYLAEVRPLLLGGRESTAMWVGARGADMIPMSVANCFGLRVKARFGVRFGPHRCRHAISTTAALEVPDDPALASRVLAITPDVTNGHYNRAEQAGAARDFNRLIGMLQAEAIKRRGYRHGPTHPNTPPVDGGAS